MSLIDLDLPDLILITLEFFFRNLNFEANLFNLRVALPESEKFEFSDFKFSSSLLIINFCLLRIPSSFRNDKILFSQKLFLDRTTLNLLHPGVALSESEKSDFEFLRLFLTIKNSLVHFKDTVAILTHSMMIRYQVRFV